VWELGKNSTSETTKTHANNEPQGKLGQKDLAEGAERPEDRVETKKLNSLFTLTKKTPAPKKSRRATRGVRSDAPPGCENAGKVEKGRQPNYENSGCERVNGTPFKKNKKTTLGK